MGIKRTTTALSTSLPLLALALAVGCSKPASIEMKPAAVDLATAGQTMTVAATALDKSGAPMPGAEFVWATADAAVATVDATGQVKAVASGQTTITAAVGEVSGTATVKVAIVGSLSIDPSEVELRGAGLTQTIEITADSDKGEPMTDAPISWTNENPAVATVDGKIITSVGNGETTLTAKSGEITATVRVVVAAPRATSMTVQPDSIILTSGKTDQLIPAVIDDRDETMANPIVTWASADPAIATVDATGLVTAVSRGRTSITGTIDSVVVEIPVRVAR